MKENKNSVHFNHGYLCEMLRAASKTELEDVLNDVAKEKQRREEIRKTGYEANIHNAIDEAIKAGYEINFRYVNCGNTTFMDIHKNNVHNLNIDIL